MDRTKEDKLSLANLKGGAAIEAFDLILKNEVLTNIQDPNTDTKPAREITLKVKFKPDEDRFLSGISIECWPSKLAKRRTMTSQMVMDVDRDGVIVAKEVLPKQGALFNEPDIATVRELKEA